MLIADITESAATNNNNKVDRFLRFDVAFFSLLRSIGLAEKAADPFTIQHRLHRHTVVRGLCKSFQREKSPF